ncbi:MAG: ABC transporter permease [Eubacteriales bacterium]
MYLFRNSLKNIRRFSGRYKLFGILLLIIFAVLCAAIMLYTYTAAMTELIKLEYGATMRLHEMDELYDFDIYERLDMVNNIEILGYNRCFFGTDIASVIINGRDVSKEPYLPYTNYYIGGLRSETETPFNREDSPAEIMEGGRLFENENECVMSSYMADEIGCAVGDIISYTIYINGEEISHSYTVTGIFKSAADVPRDMSRYVPTIYTTMEGAAIFKYDDDFMYTAFGFDNMKIYLGYDAKVHLVSYDIAREFMNEVDTLSEGEDGAIYYYDGFRTLVTPLSNITIVSAAFIILFILIGIAVISVMTSLLLSERKYEIGVLMSMGMSRPKLCAGYIIEYLVFVAIVLIPGCTLGFAGFFVGMRWLPAYEGISASVTSAIGTSFGAMAILSLSLALFSILISTLYITRYDTAKILRSRY